MQLQSNTWSRQQKEEPGWRSYPNSPAAGISPIRKFGVGRRPGGVATLGKYYFNRLFLGTNGFSLKEGLTTPSPAEAEVKATMLRQSQYKYLVSDSSKYSRISFAKFGELRDLNAVITDSDIPAEAEQEIRDLGLRLVLAPRV